MTNSIYRTALPITDYQKLDLTGPPISVAADRRGDPAMFDLWFEHYDESAREMHRDYDVWVFGTGNAVPWTTSTRGLFEFIGSFSTSAFQVWHVYTGPPQDML